MVIFAMIIFWVFIPFCSGLSSFSFKIFSLLMVEMRWKKLYVGLFSHISSSYIFLPWHLKVCFLAWQTLLGVSVSLTWVMLLFRRHWTMLVEQEQIAPPFYKMELVTAPTQWKAIALMLPTVTSRGRGKRKGLVISLARPLFLQQIQVSFFVSSYTPSNYCPLKM